MAHYPSGGYGSGAGGGGSSQAYGGGGGFGSGSAGSGGGSQGFGVQVRSITLARDGDCFKCGKMGHKYRDCINSGGGSYGDLGGGHDSARANDDGPSGGWPDDTSPNAQKLRAQEEELARERVRAMLAATPQSRTGTEAAIPRCAPAAAESAAAPHASDPSLLSAASSAQAALFTCTLSVRRLQLQQRLYAITSDDRTAFSLLAAVDVPIVQAKLRAGAVSAFEAWQEASHKTARACLDAGLEPAAFEVLEELRWAAHQRATNALAAYKSGLQRTHEIAMRAAPGSSFLLRGPDASATTLQYLHALIKEYDGLGGTTAAPAKGAQTHIASLADALIALAPNSSDSAAVRVLANASATALGDVASAAATASSPPSRINATLYLVNLARAAVQPLQPLTPDAAEQQRALHHQELADLGEREQALQQQGALTARAAALAAAWPPLQDAERAARQAAKKASREVEDLRDDGQAPSAELLARCEEKLARQTAALAACEGAREGARALAAADCPDALRLLRAMHPPPPPAVHATELDRMWAELEDAGVALPFRRADYIDSAQVARAHANVFSARLRGSEERVVLKEFSALGADLRLFCNEARLLRRLAHPNILALGGVLRSGTHLYLQLPYVEGGSLREWLAGGGPAALPRTPAQCVRAFCGTMAALAYVHSCGVVHRDLKPDNILMHLDGSPRLADFGISISAAGGGTTLATAAAFHGAGTEDYKAPEQLRGERASPASDVYAAGLVLHEIVFRRPYALPVEARRQRGGADAPPLIPPASAAAEGWPEGLVEAARALLARLLAPAASDRPVANAVLADLFCERSSELLAGGGGGGAAAGGQGAGEASALARAQQALAALARTARRVPAVGAIDLPRGDALLPAAAAALAEHFMAVGGSGGGAAPAQPPRLVLTLGGETDPERALDALLAAALRPALRLFGTAAPYDDEGAGEAAGSGPVLPLAPRGGREEAHAAALFAVGAALAQAALQGCTELNTLARLPPLAFAAIARGQGAALAALAALPAALAALATFDADKARALRSVLAGRAADFALELPNWQGVGEAVTDANKATLVQRECERLLVRSRAAAWEALHAGFLGGGGRAVLAAMDAAALPCLRGLVYDAGKSERRRAALGSLDSADADFVAAHTRPCPSAACRAACTKDSGCMHVRCGACGTAWNWCCGTVEAGHPARSCPRGGDVGVRLQI